jgi:hypothetical protein
VLAVGAAAGVAPAAAQTPFEWEPLVYGRDLVPELVDVAGPRRDGRFVVAGLDRLALYRPGGELKPFARGPAGYSNPGSHEGYIALSEGGSVDEAGCRWKRDQVFAVDTAGDVRVIRVTRRGRATAFADMPDDSYLSAITFDDVGLFGHRLLVAARFGTAGEASVDLYGIDCRGQARVYVEDAPEVEGGMEVAPPSFEPYGGLLIAPDEIDGTVLAFGPDGSWQQIASVAQPVGYDMGIENVSFVPPGFGRADAAYMADKDAPGSFHPGTNSLLAATGREIRRAGALPGDIIGATEGGAETFRIRCTGAGCDVARIGTGPEIAHAEGHIEFGPAP